MLCVVVMLDTGAGADSPVHVYQEIDSIDQSVGKGRLRFNGHPKIFDVLSCHFDQILVIGNCRQLVKLKMLYLK